MVGLRTEDALVCARFLAGYESDGEPRQVRLIGVGETGVPALHAAALEPRLFAAVRLERTLTSFADLVRTPEPAGQLVHAVHGALEVYDLPDLMRLCGRDVMTVESPVDGAGNPVERE
jgi:hypothetical protein